MWYKSNMTHQASKFTQDLRAQIGKQCPNVQLFISHCIGDYSKTGRVFSKTDIIILKGEASFGKGECEGFGRNLGQCVLKLFHRGRQRMRRRTSSNADDAQIKVGGSEKGQGRVGMRARMRRETEVEVAARERARHETGCDGSHEEGKDMGPWRSAPRSSLASPGMSPRRMDSNERISAAYASNVALGIWPTGRRRMRTWAREAKA